MSGQPEIEPKSEFPPELRDQYSLIIPSNKISGAQKVMAYQINRDYQGRRPILLTVLNGARRTTEEMKKYFAFDYDVDEIEVASYGKKSESSGVIKLVKDMRLDPRAREVLISEDVLDTGLTLQYLHYLLRERGAADVQIAVLVAKDKSRLLVNNVRAKYIGIPDVRGYIVGHGFDDRGHFRELDHIYLKNDPDFDPTPFIK